MFGDPESVIDNAINTVADVADVQVGLVIKPTRFYSADGTGTPAFRSLNIGEMYIRDSEWIYFTDKGMVENQRTIAHTGDVLVVRSGYPGTSCVVTPEYDGRNVVDLIIAHPNVSKILPEFLCAFTNYPHGKIQIENSQRGVAQKHFNVSLYNKMKIVVPPMELQKQFVQLFHQSDKSKFSCLKSQFIEMFGDPFENPKGYVKKTIGDVCDFQGGSQPPRKEFVFKPQEGYVRLIQIRDYKTDDYITYAPEKMCRRFCDADDIMIGRYGPPIFQILQGIEGAYNVALMKAIPHGINKEFMRAYLKRDELLHHLELFSTRTAGQSGIEMSELRGYPCLVPPEEEQLQYVEFVKQSDKSK